VLGSCTTTDGPRVKRDRTRDCPPGQVQICESRQQREPSSGGDEEIPEYDFCRCESIGLWFETNVLLQRADLLPGRQQQAARGAPRHHRCKPFTLL